MAVYTCYDMIRDCRENRAEGWIYLADTFAQAIGILARHYGGGPDTTAEVLRRLKAPDSIFRTMAPCHQREFLFQLRPLILQTAAPKDTLIFDAEPITSALTALSATERQAAWFETMGYSAEETAVLMRMAPDTVAKLRTRVAELLRAGLDDWSQDMLVRNGRALGAALEQETVAEPLEFRHFLDVIDGRITWQRKAAFDRQLETHWPEVHKACRIREADQALAAKAQEDPEPYLAVLGVSRPKPSRWKALLARS